MYPLYVSRWVYVHHRITRNFYIEMELSHLGEGMLVRVVDCDDSDSSVKTYTQGWC